MTAQTTNPASGPAPAAQPRTTAAESTAANKAAFDDTLAATVEQAKYNRALEPQTFDDGWKLAVMAAKLRLCGVMSPEDGYARIITGRAIGLPAMASIQGIALIENKKNDSWTPCMYAKLKSALLLSRHDIIEYFRPVELTDKIATYIGKRRGHPEVSYSFTWDDAVRAGLVGRGEGNNYDKHPRSMLQWRAVGRLADIIGGDILNGIASREDLDDVNVDTEERAPQPPPAAVPVRDWKAEADAVKRDLQKGVLAGDKAAIKAAFDRMKALHAEAPKAIGEDLMAFYASVKGGAAKPAPAAATGPAAAAPATTAPATTAPKAPAPPTDTQLANATGLEGLIAKATGADLARLVRSIGQGEREATITSQQAEALRSKVGEREQAIRAAQAGADSEPPANAGDAWEGGS